MLWIWVAIALLILLGIGWLVALISAFGSWLSWFAGSFPLLAFLLLIFLAGVAVYEFFRARAAAAIAAAVPGAGAVAPAYRRRMWLGLAGAVVALLLLLGSLGWIGKNLATSHVPGPPPPATSSPAPKPTATLTSQQVVQTAVAATVQAQPTAAPTQPAPGPTAVPTQPTGPVPTAVPPPPQPTQPVPQGPTGAYIEQNGVHQTGQGAHTKTYPATKLGNDEAIIAFGYHLHWGKHDDGPCALVIIPGGRNIEGLTITDGEGDQYKTPTGSDYWPAVIHEANGRAAVEHNRKLHPYYQCPAKTYQNGQIPVWTSP